MSGHAQDLSDLLGQAGPTSINLPPMWRQPGRRREPCEPGQCGGPGSPQHRGGCPRVHLRGAGRALRLIDPLAVWVTRRDRDPFNNDAGREALNFGISIAVYGSLLLVAALM